MRGGGMGAGLIHGQLKLYLLFIASAKFWSLSGASHYPDFMVLMLSRESAEEVSPRFTTGGSRASTRTYRQRGGVI